MQVGCSERLIMQEFKACTQHLRKGIVIQPSVTNVFQWQITMMPSSGLFADQILTCSIVFDNFPAVVPKIFFKQGTFHPMIYPNDNHFECSEMFKEWSISNRVYTLINYIFDSFVEISVPGNASVPNPEAASLLRKGQDFFVKRALETLPSPADPSELTEQNAPARWNPQKEKIAQILVSINRDAARSHN